MIQFTRATITTAALTTVGVLALCYLGSLDGSAEPALPVCPPAGAQAITCQPNPNPYDDPPATPPEPATQPADAPAPAGLECEVDGHQVTTGPTEAAELDLACVADELVDEVVRCQADGLVCQIERDTDGTYSVYGRDCQEDEPCWQCETMGNGQCGPPEGQE